MEGFVCYKHNMLMIHVTISQYNHQSEALTAFENIDYFTANHDSIFPYARNQSYTCDLFPRAEKGENIGYLREFKEGISS